MALPMLGPGNGTGQVGLAGDTPSVLGTGGAFDTAPSGQFAMLIELQEDGHFLGYVPLAGQFDPISGKLVYRVPASPLEGTLFLPVVLRPAQVSNFNGAAHIWSSPFKDGADFGVAAPQFTTVTVLAPHVGQRLLVYNPVTNNIGWIDALGVGPAAGP